MKVGFLITAYDQKKEVKYTVDMLRKKWKRTAESPIVIVISGDPEREVKFPNDGFTRVVTIDDIVGKDFNELVSTSICKQLQHGLLEARDLERAHGPIDFLVHMHGDILLLNEDGFFDELEKFAKSKKLLACDTVGPQKNDYIEFDGLEIMPQLFVMTKVFKDTFERVISQPETEWEKKSTEWLLRRVVYRTFLMYNFDTTEKEEELQNKYIHFISKHRSSQWGVHQRWGGWCHHGNQLHFSKEHREAMNKSILTNNGDLEAWEKC